MWIVFSSNRGSLYIAIFHGWRKILSNSADSVKNFVISPLFFYYFIHSLTTCMCTSLIVILLYFYYLIIILLFYPLTDNLHVRLLDQSQKSLIRNNLTTGKNSPSSNYHIIHQNHQNIQQNIEINIKTNVTVICSHENPYFTTCTCRC